MTSLLSPTQLLIENMAPLAKAGFGVYVYTNDEDEEDWTRLQPENNGYLFSQFSDLPAEFYLCIKTPRRLNARVVTVIGGKRADGRQKVIVPKTDDRTRNNPDYAVFGKLVRNRTTEEENEFGEPILATKHDGNNLRLIIVREDKFSMWEAAIVTRINEEEASFFLTVQKLYQANLFNLNGKIYLPEWQYPGYWRWPSLQEFLPTMVKVSELRPISRPLPKPNDFEETPPLGNHEGIVKYFCLASGLGLAETADGPGQIHWRQIRTDSEDELEFTCLKKGQKISFGEKTERLTPPGQAYPSLIGIAPLD